MGEHAVRVQARGQHAWGVAARHVPPLEVASIEHRRPEVAHESLLTLTRRKRRLLNNAVDALCAAPLGVRGKLIGGLVHVTLSKGEEADTLLLADADGRESLPQPRHGGWWNAGGWRH